MPAINNKICLMTSVHHSFDSRIFYREAVTLAESGYNVTLIAPNRENEIRDEINIIKFPEYDSKYKRIIFSPLKMLALSLTQRAKVYHFHDPELIITGLLLKVFLKKVIYDTHENTPKDILDKHWIKNRLIKKMISLFMDYFEKFSAYFFDFIVAATRDIGERFPESKTYIIRNVPILDLIEKSKSFKIKKARPAVIYAGDLTSIRGIIEIINAMEILNGRAELWLFGRWSEAGLEEKCLQQKGWKYTKYFGFVKPDVTYGYLKSADIGITILHPAKNFITSLATKTFEYMACSIPVVMSDFPYWQQQFDGFALFADPLSPADIAKKINMLLENNDLRKKLIKNGKELVAREYNWEKEKRKLLDAYEKIFE